MEQIDERAKSLLNEIKRDADNLLQGYQSSIKNHNFKIELDEKEKIILEKVNTLLDLKETENYTYDDWSSKARNYFDKKDFNKALEMTDKALAKTINNHEIVSALNDKGVIFGALEETEKAIEVYNELVERFKESKEKGTLEIVILALLNKIESSIILSKDYSDDIELFKKLAQGNVQRMQEYKMLEILENSKTQNQDKEIALWQEEFKNRNLNDWGFNELKVWANKLESGVKNRILGYISIFENHNANLKLEL